jgi:diguanylate cyclase (GGDEF)-like protein
MSACITLKFTLQAHRLFMFNLTNLIQFLDLRTILAVGGLVAYAAAAAMAVQAFKAQTYRYPLGMATLGLAFGGTSLIFGSLSNVDPFSSDFLLARIFGTGGFLCGMCALLLMFWQRLPKLLVLGVSTLSLLGFAQWSSGEGLLNWSSFCQTVIAGVTAVAVLMSKDRLTPKLRFMAIVLCLLVALGPLPHLYTSGVTYFELTLPLFDAALAYRFRIVLNVTVLVLGYSCMNALTQARDALALRESIDFDMLTGAHSRRYLFEADDKILRRERVAKTHATTVLLLDIDHFKQINDQWGHQVGDQVLAYCVQQIRHVVRTTDAIVARYGGEEFCIVVPKISFKAAAALAERVRHQIQSQPFVSEGHSIAFTVSIGISHRHEATPLTELIRIADELLYAAKRSGRNRVNFNTAQT